MPVCISAEFLDTPAYCACNSIIFFKSFDVEFIAVIASVLSIFYGFWILEDCVTSRHGSVFDVKRRFYDYPCMFSASSQSAAESTEAKWAGTKHGGDFNSFGWAPRHRYCNARTTGRLHRTS